MKSLGSYFLLVALAAMAIAFAQEEDSFPTESTATEEAPMPHSSKKKVPLIKLPDSYIDLYKLILAQPRNQQRPGFETDAELASVALRLWERTHDERFKKIAVDDFATAFSNPDFSLVDFHILHHFGELIWRMKKDGLLTSDEQKKLVALAKEELTQYLKQPDDTRLPIGAPLYNIRIAQLLGYAGLLKFLEGESFNQRQTVQKRLDDYFELLVKLGNTDEDATNYDSLGLAFTIDLARLLNREEELKTPGFRRYFENFRDIVSPSGIHPEYGDAYFGYEDLPMDRVFLMEYAARIYHDPTFLDALNKMKVRPQRGLPPADHWIRSLSLIDMPDSMLKAVSITNQPSQVLLRNADVGRNSIKEVPDKLILRTGREPGDSMVMMDLYASGSHAHRDKGPSVAYYENAQVPLFHNMGRHGSRSAINGNICWALSPDQQFPGFWLPSQWFTMNYPVDLISTNNEGRFVLTKLELRNFPERNKLSESLSFDNLRLTGSSGTLLVDSFDTSDGWGKDLKKDKGPVSSADKTQGLASQFIPWSKEKTKVIERIFPNPLPSSFTKAEYTQLKLDVKYQGIKPYMLVRGLVRRLNSLLTNSVPTFSMPLWHRKERMPSVRSVTKIT